MCDLVSGHLLSQTKQRLQPGCSAQKPPVVVARPAYRQLHELHTIINMHKLNICFDKRINEYLIERNWRHERAGGR